MKQIGSTVKILMIKTIALLTLAFLVSGSSGQAQNYKPNKMYRIWANQQMERADWILYQVKDTSLIVSNSREHSDYYTGLTGVESQEFGIQDLDNIYLRRNGKAGGFMLLGILGGFLTGVTIGLIEGDSEKKCFFGPCVTAEKNTGFDKGVGYGVGLGLLGGAVGAIVGSIKIKVPINRNKEKFDLNQPRLAGYAYF